MGLALEHEPEDRDEHEQQREQREERVVGDQCRKAPRTIVAELLYHGDRDRQRPSPLLSTVERTHWAQEIHARVNTPPWRRSGGFHAGLRPVHAAATSGSDGSGAGWRWCRITVARPLGLNVMLRRPVCSGASRGAESEYRRSTVLSTIFISCIAKLAPRQRRRPPPNGIHVYVPGGLSRKRAGRNA